MSERSTKYSHDSFLQKQDSQLGWIRNVMRVSGIDCDFAPNLAPAGLAFALQEWVGSPGSGSQLDYYHTKSSAYVEHSTRLARLARFVGFTATGLVVLAAIVGSDQLRDLLLVVLAVVLLLFSVRQSYAYRIAERDLIKQYHFMLAIFSNVRKRLRAATTDAERRKILRVLGEAALDEHAGWIFLHRERTLDPGSVLRMEP